MATQTVSMRLDSTLLDTVKRIAKMNGLTLSSIVSVKLREFAEEKSLHLVDDEDFEIDFGKKGVPIDDVIEYLESLN